MTAPAPVANARMYSVAPSARDAWTALFHHVAATSGIPLQVIEHPFPLLVSDLWQRPDLAAAFMCGWPWIRGVADVVPVAAPLPADADGPRYWSDIVVRADHPARSLQDLAGARLGYTLLDSQSGFSALRHHLLSLGGRAPRFGHIEGPLTTPRRMMEAVAEGRIDAGPIDSFAHALLRRHVPELTARIRILDRTEPTPVPLLVAHRDTDPAVVARLSAAFLAVEDRALLEPLAITGFTAPLPPAEYAVMETRARAAEAAGIHDLAPFLKTPVPA